MLQRNKGEDAVNWFSRLLRRGRLEKQLDAELRFDYEQRVAENISCGMDEAGARRVARLQFGGLEQVKEECRDVRGLQHLDSLVQDVRYALRGMRRSPAFTVVAVMTLALGIGVNATVFTVTNAVLFKGFALVERNDRLLYISQHGCCVSYPDFEDYRAQSKSFTGMGITHGVGIVFSDKSGFTEHRDGTEISADTFRLVGQRPILGRDFRHSDETPGAAPVAILSYGFWQSRYAKNPGIIGQTVRMNGAATTLIGVMPAGFSFPQKVDVWVPLVPTPAVRMREASNSWFVFGRLADGITIQVARTEIENIGRRLSTAWPLTNHDLHPSVQTFSEFFIGSNAAMIYGSMWGAVGFVLLIACANLANLLLARSMARSREISVRIALGAGRWRIIRQLLIESLMLSGAGGFLGWWIAQWGVRAYERAMLARASWLIVDYSMDYRVLGYLIAISVGTGILFGLVPALRLSKLDVNATLKDGGRGSSGRTREKHLSLILVAGEMALAVVLLAGAGVMIRSFLKIHSADMGVQTENVLVAALDPPSARYATAETRASFYARLTRRVAAIPGVESVAMADVLPSWPAAKRPFELAGVSSADIGRRPTLSAITITPTYFRTLGARVLSGRAFNDKDGVSGVPAVLVNQRFARKYWPGEDPLGKRLRMFNKATPGDWMTVVGTVSNIVQNDANRQDFGPVVYLPWREKAPPSMWVYVRTHVPPASLFNPFRGEIQSIDSELPIYGPFTLSGRLEMFWDSRFYGFVFVIFAGIALLLASIGLYTVIAHSVRRRTQEIGVRMAVGATAGDVLALVFRQGMLPLGAGLVIGIAASFVVNRLLKSALVQVSPGDPVTLAVASGVLIVAAALGCWIPARRAIAVDPVAALRHE